MLYVGSHSTAYNKREVLRERDREEKGRKRGGKKNDSTHLMVIVG
jgi:hypothetical protein